jgi:hypothetical protein
MDPLERINGELFATFNPEDEIFIGGASESVSNSQTNNNQDSGNDHGVDT